MSLRAIRPCGIAAADFAPDNRPPDGRLFGAHPLRVRIPPQKIKKHQSFDWCFFLEGVHKIEPHAVYD